MDMFWYFIIIIICLFLSAFFSGSETALLRLRKERLEKDLAKSKKPGVAVAKILLSSTSRLLVTILLGNNIVNILAASSASIVAAYYLGEGMGLFVATAVMTIIIFVFSEVFPKAIGAYIPAKISYLVSLPLYIFHIFLRPVHILMDKIMDPLLKKFFKKSDDEHDSLHDDLLFLARTAPSYSGSEASPISIISSAAKAADMTAEQIMIPRSEIVAFDVNTPADLLIEKFLKERYTRVPIYDGSIDKILGMIHLKDLVFSMHKGEADIKDILKPIVRVPLSKPILDLIAEMKKGFFHMAIVKDEFGVIQGLVTLEDILEEIVGEIRDEFDREELQKLYKINENNYNALATLKISDFNRETGWKLPDEGTGTLASLILDDLGRNAKRQDEVEIGQYRLIVFDMSGSKIKRVRVQKL